MEKESTKSIKFAFFLNLGFSIFELIGGTLVNSISIMSDSVHDFGDALSIAISWFLDKKSAREPDEKYTYGYLRFSLLGALINCVVLFTGSFIMIYNAIPRIINPQSINYDGVLLLAVIGLFVNGLGVYKTAKGEAISEKTVSLHLLEDVLGWASVLICSIFMKIFDFPILDPILSILISAFILFNVGKNLKRIFDVFLEKSPEINTEEIKKHILKNRFIKDIHHVHLWTLDSINNYCSMHVVIQNNTNKNEIIEIKKYIKEELQEHNIQHATLEIEFCDENCNEQKCLIKAVPTAHSHHHH